MNETKDVIRKIKKLMAIVDIHPVLKSYHNKFFVTKNSHFVDLCIDGYEMGLKDGSAYHIDESAKKEV